MKIYTISEDIKAELAELTRQADELSASFKTEFVCLAGCSGCCETFLWNLVEIINVREDKKYSTTLKKLHKRIKAYNREYHRRKKIMGDASNDFDIFSTFFKDLRCIFLHDSKCLVYENRPILCRLYASRDKERCAGLHELSPDYHERANHILMQTLMLNSRYTQLFHPGYTVQGLPFRYLMMEETAKTSGAATPNFNKG